MSELLKYSFAKVFSPASVSNVGPGFDSFGFALEEPGDVIEVRTNKTGEVRIKNITGDNGRLPRDAKENTASVAVSSLLKKLNADFGVDLIIRKKMPFASGLGSSAASSVGAAFAVNCLLKNPLSKDDLIFHALDGEKISSGSIAHADNVAPALYGGFTIVRSLDPMSIVNIAFPEELSCMIIFPHMEIKTKEARKILPVKVPLKDAVKQSANAASLVASIYKKDFALLAASLKDYFAEPLRAKLIPCYEPLSSFVLSTGALNFNISGSGPAIFAFYEDEKKMQEAGRKIKKWFSKSSLDVTLYYSRVNNNGPVLLEAR